MSISGSATAVARGGPARAILIEGASAGTATFNAAINANGLSDNLLASNGTCLISMTWTNPNNAAQSRSYGPRVKTTTTPTARTWTSILLMFAGSSFNTNCRVDSISSAWHSGPKAAGFTTLSASIVLGEEV